MPMLCPCIPRMVLKDANASALWVCGDSGGSGSGALSLPHRALHLFPQEPCMAAAGHRLFPKERPDMNTQSTSIRDKDGPAKERPS